MNYDSPSKKKRGRPKRSDDSIPLEMSSPEMSRPPFQINEDDYVFYIKTSQTSAIKSLFDSLKEFNNGKQILEFALDGIHSFNSYVKDNNEQYPKACVDLYRENFDGYYHIRRPMKLIIDTESLLRLLKNFTTEQSIAFAMQELDVTQLHVIVDSTKNGIVITNKINTQSDASFDLQSIAITETNQTVIIQSQLFNNICKNMASLSSHITFEINEQKMRAYCAQDNIYQEIMIPCIMQNESENDIINVTFLLQNITKFSKSIALCKNITLHFDNDCPLVIVSQIGTLGSINIQVPLVNVN